MLQEGGEARVSVAVDVIDRFDGGVACGIAVDRGRLVRAAIAAALADLEENGDSADVISRLGD